jgi:transposase
VKSFAYRRVKNDVRDASDLADLLRMGRLPEAWIAPPYLRQLRELVRYRAKVVALRSGLKAQVHVVLAKEGVAVGMSACSAAVAWPCWPTTRLGTCYRMRVDSLLELIDAFDGEVAFLSDAIAARLRHHPGYHAIQQIPKVGPTFAAVFVVETVAHARDTARCRHERL